MMWFIFIFIGISVGCPATVMTGSDGWGLMLDSAASGKVVGVGSATRSLFTDFSMGIPMLAGLTRRTRVVIKGYLIVTLIDKDI